MAPSATETVTLPARNVESVKYTSATGPYKEIAPIGYEKEAEKEGKDGFKAAKVRTSRTVCFQSLADLDTVSKLPSHLG
jgi:hypothetical protein